LKYPEIQPSNTLDDFCFPLYLLCVHNHNLTGFLSMRIYIMKLNGCIQHYSTVAVKSSGMLGSWPVHQ